MTLTNVYGFVASDANSNGIDPTGAPVPLEQRRELDRWMLSRLHTTTGEVIEALDGYNPTRAARAIEALVDALSNWYIRRSRPVFWAGKKDTGVSDADKRAAYQTTYTVLLGIARLMAPIAPFYADWLHQALLGDASAASSVHLADFPVVDQSMIAPELEHRMALARTIVSTTCLLSTSPSPRDRQKPRMPSPA